MKELLKQKIMNEVNENGKFYFFTGLGCKLLEIALYELVEERKIELLRHDRYELSGIAIPYCCDFEQDTAADCRGLIDDILKNNQ